LVVKVNGVGDMIMGERMFWQGGWCEGGVKMGMKKMVTQRREGARGARKEKESSGLVEWNGLEKDEGGRMKNERGRGGQDWRIGGFWIEIGWAADGRG
jgi:hypothetical protein